jgi:hypothetical protein
MISPAREQVLTAWDVNPEDAGVEPARPERSLHTIPSTRRAPGLVRRNHGRAPRENGVPNPELEPVLRRISEIN